MGKLRAVRKRVPGQLYAYRITSDPNDYLEKYFCDKHVIAKGTLAEFKHQPREGSDDNAGWTAAYRVGCWFVFSPQGYFEVIPDELYRAEYEDEPAPAPDPSTTH